MLDHQRGMLTTAAPLLEEGNTVRSIQQGLLLCWQPGDIVDVDVEDGMEFGATVLGPSISGDTSELSIRFADGVVDDWPVEELRRPAAAAAAAISELVVSTQPVVPVDANVGADEYGCSPKQPNAAAAGAVLKDEPTILKPLLFWLGGNDDIGGLPQCDTEEATLVVQWQVPRGFSTSRFRVGFKHSSWWTWAYEDCDLDNTPSCSRVASDDNGLSPTLCGFVGTCDSYLTPN